MMHADQGRLQAYLDHEMPEAHRSSLESHLTACVACRGELEELQRLGAEVRAALVGIDMAVGTASALQKFRERHAALGGAPAAANGRIRPRGQLRWAGPPTPARFARASLLKAASLALLLGGALYAAVPGSPLGRWIGDTLFPSDEPASSPEIVPPQAPVAATPEEAPSDVTGIRMAEGAVQIRLRSLSPNTRVRIRLVDGDLAQIRAAGPFEGTTRTGAGWIEVGNLEGVDFMMVDLPRAAVRATVEVNGQVWLRKVGPEITTPGPVTERNGDEVTFRSGS
jgi:hypothetical protein